MLLSVAGIAYCIGQVDGPFGAIAKVRNLIMRIPYVGPAVFEWLRCRFCFGFWVSAGVYLLVNAGYFSVVDMVLWCFAGAMFNTVIGALLDKLALFFER